MLIKGNETVYVYTNRWNDKITFTKCLNKVEVTGYDPICIRVMAENDNLTVLSMVDPSGGPALYKGDNLGHINKNWLGLLIQNIELNKDKIILTIK